MRHTTQWLRRRRPPQRPDIPSAPVASNVGQDSATLSWEYEPDVSFTLQRSTDQVEWTTVYSGTATSATDTGLQPGTDYYYRRGVTDGDGAVLWSGLVAVQTDPVLDNVPPAPGALTLVDVTTSSVTVQRPDVVGATSYVWQRATQGGSFATVYTGTNPPPEGEVLHAGHTPYHVRVGQSTPADGTSDWPPNTTEALQILGRPLSMHRRFNDWFDLQWLKDEHAENWARGEMVFASYDIAPGGNWNNVVDGTYDPQWDQIRQWAKTLRTSGPGGTPQPIALTFNHEPEGDGPHGDTNNAADAVADMALWGRGQNRMSNFFAGWTTKADGSKGTYNAANDVSDILAWHLIFNGNWMGPKNRKQDLIDAALTPTLVRNFRENKSVIAGDFYDPTPRNKENANDPNRDTPPFDYPSDADRTHRKMTAFVAWAREQNTGAIGCGEFSATEATEITRCWEVIREARDIWTVASHFNSARNSRWPWRLIPDSYPGGQHPDNYRNGVLVLRDFGGSPMSEARLNAFRTMVDESVSAEFTSSPTDPSPGNTSDTFVDQPLQPGTSYSYRVAAANEYGTSAWSPVLTVKTTSLTPPPPTPNAPLITATTANSVTLEWLADGDTYTLQRSRDKVAWTTVYSGPNREFTNTGLLAVTTYHYRLSATGEGGTSGWSPIASATTESTVSPPSGTAQPISAKYARGLMGTNVHANFKGGYENAAGIGKFVADIGFTWARSLIGADDSVNAAYDSWARQHNVKFLHLGTRASVAESDSVITGRIREIANKWPTTAGAFEGMNEPSHYLGGTLDYWMDHVLHTQELIYKTVKSVLPNATVVGPSMHEAEALAALQQGQNWWKMLADRGLLRWCDVVALHTYPYQGDPTNQLDYRAGIIRDAWPGKPLWITETGFSDDWATYNPATHGPAYGGRFPLEFLQRKLPVFQYELIDDVGTQSGVQRVFGIVDTNNSLNASNWVRKPFATAMKSVLDEWRDPVGTADYTPAKVKCDISGGASNVRSVLTATKAQSNAGTATLFLYRAAAPGTSTVNVTVTDRAGSRTFAIGPTVTKVHLR